MNSNGMIADRHVGSFALAVWSILVALRSEATASQNGRFPVILTLLRNAYFWPIRARRPRSSDPRAGAS